MKMQTKQLRFEVKVKNNRLYHEIYAQHKSICDFCDLEGISYGSVVAFLNLSWSPYKPCGMSHIALRLCEIFHKDPAWLFPPEIYEKDKRSKWVIETNLKRLAIIEEARPRIEYLSDSKVNYESGSKIMREVLKTISEREAKVITERYGLNGGHPKTLEDCAKIFRVTRERIRQIEGKAIRKLRHRTRSNVLRSTMLGDSPVNTTAGGM